MVVEILFILATAAFALYGGYKLITEYAGRKRAKGAPPSEEIRAALRQQWLDLLPGEKDIPGVEWEGEVYYETPK
jgi:hypothetical protein